MLLRIFKLLKKNEQGFSMLELLVYVGIVGIIVSFAVPRYTNAIAMANTAKIQADLQTLDAAIMMYQLQTGEDPTDISTDLKNYVANVDKLKPPTGKCILKAGGVQDIDASEYSVAKSEDGGEAEACLGTHKLADFGKPDSGSAGGSGDE